MDKELPREPKDGTPIMLTTTKQLIEKIYILLPYIGKLSERLHTLIQKQLLEHTVFINPAFNTTKIDLYYGLKDIVSLFFSLNHKSFINLHVAAYRRY